MRVFFPLNFSMLTDYLKTLVQFLIPKHKLTQLAGFLADSRSPRIKNFLIRRFIRQYQVNMHEACDENADNYLSFNEFFIRYLKPECRPLAAADIVSPVDGFVSELGIIKQGQILQAKRRFYTVEQLLSCEKTLSKQFTNGFFITFYLAPKNYHRIHMPINATLKEMIYIPGKLFSVQPTTARVIPHLFARNERLVIFFDTQVGLMAMVLVGAAIVGAIGTKWHGDLKRAGKKQFFSYTDLSEENTRMLKGSEMGYFKLGSTVILLFAQGHKIQWLPLDPNQSICYGEALGQINRD